MAGSSALVCRGFLETETFSEAKAEFQEAFGLDDKAMEDRLSALQWALLRNPSPISELVGSRNLWVAVAPEGLPSFRVYLRPSAGVPNECDLLWIEERF